MKYQLTTDGSRSFDEIKIGYAGYISNDSGKILFVFYEHKNITIDYHIDANLFEYYGVMHGLNCALSMGIKKISCFNDSLSLIEACNYYAEEFSFNKKVPTMQNIAKKDRYLLPLLEIISQFDDIEFHHLPRKRNQYSDYLSHIWKHTKKEERKDFFKSFIELGGSLEYDFFDVAKQYAIDKMEQRAIEKYNDSLIMSGTEEKSKKHKK